MESALRWILKCRRQKKEIAQLAGKRRRPGFSYNLFQVWPMHRFSTPIGIDVACCFPLPYLTRVCSAHGPSHNLGYIPTRSVIQCSCGRAQRCHRKVGFHLRHYTCTLKFTGPHLSGTSATFSLHEHATDMHLTGTGQSLTLGQIGDMLFPFLHLLQMPQTWGRKRESDPTVVALCQPWYDFHFKFPCSY